ncbi:uncharacterized protein LOC120637233 [Pararge aegeria]|uniref:uncharacterized protein LOC120637233 n=1 Tax=Pararge aegeria TaxID=116150 RepID=UPI0019D0AC6A|nr:uncharacterized protein LOC120637233 [Pararge aegeria]XP_039764890.1 uncharacterized protein LOC120637233 [Pararge aegeria]
MERTEKPYPGCRDIIRRSLLRRDVPLATVNIMLASLAESSIKQYDVSIKKWFVHCTRYSINMFEASVPEVLNFLTSLFNGGSQYGTLNSCRAALSLILDSNITRDNRIERFFKGVFRLRPPLPRYNVTWDTSRVLDYLAKNYPNESLSLKKLSYKCVTLLALTTTHRVQTLSKIIVNNIEISSSKIIIKIPDLIKSSRPGSNQPALDLPFFPEKPAVCPAHTLISYLSKTAALRSQDYLFISFKKPFKIVSTQTLSRWIKTTLRDAGIDVSIFSAHSTRHASTSKAYSSGISIELIRKTAGWSQNSNTFWKYYNKGTISNQECNSLARAIIID